METLRDRFERLEAYLKKRLSEYKEVMPVKWGKEVTLLEIYGEWMDYLVKESLKKKTDLLQKWQRFLFERNTDAIADLLIGFFEAKRRYGRDLERWEDRRDWFALCKNYCKKYWWYNDESLLHSFFSSYSWAERRIYNKVERGQFLADTSKSLFQTIALTKEEMIKAEEEKKRKAEEKARKEKEKQKRKEERAKKAEIKKQQEEEKRRRREEERVRKAEEAKLKGSKKSNKAEAVAYNTEDEDTDDNDEKEVDPDYPKAPDWRRDPVAPWSEEPKLRDD